MTKETARTWEKRSTKIIIGPTELGRMFRRSRFWARELLEEWYAEQERGGDVRVHAKRDARGRLHLETTLAVVHRYFPPARDEALVRKAKQLDEDLDFVSRRVDRLLSAIDLLEKRIARLEGKAAPLRAHARRALDE